MTVVWDVGMVVVLLVVDAVGVVLLAV